MGMLELNEEGIKRKELFIETYLTLKNDSEDMELNDDNSGNNKNNEENESKIVPYIYGSNYSNLYKFAIF